MHCARQHDTTADHTDEGHNSSHAVSRNGAVDHTGDGASVGVGIVQHAHHARYSGCSQQQPGTHPRDHHGPEAAACGGTNKLLRREVQPGVERTVPMADQHDNVTARVTTVAKVATVAVARVPRTDNHRHHHYPTAVGCTVASVDRVARAAAQQHAHAHANAHAHAHEAVTLNPNIRLQGGSTADTDAAVREMYTSAMSGPVCNRRQRIHAMAGPLRRTLRFNGVVNRALMTGNLVEAGACVEVGVSMDGKVLQCVPLPPSQVFTIGRQDWNDVCINVPSVSRLHVCIYVFPGGLVLTDGWSVGGTHVLSWGDTDCVELPASMPGDRRAILVPGSASCAGSRGEPRVSVVLGLGADVQVSFSFRKRQAVSTTCTGADI